MRRCWLGSKAHDLKVEFRFQIVFVSEAGVYCHSRVLRGKASSSKLYDAICLPTGSIVVAFLGLPYYSRIPNMNPQKPKRNY